MSILKNPMILLAMVSMGIFLGMPYLLENSAFLSPCYPLPDIPVLWPHTALTQVTRRPVDPEVRAEFEARQKSNPMNAVLGAAGGGGQPGGGFDMAAFLAGSNSGAKRDEAATPPPLPSGGNGGGKKNQRR